MNRSWGYSEGVGDLAFGGDVKSEEFADSRVFPRRHKVNSSLNPFPMGEMQFPADVDIFLLHLPRVQQEFKVVGSYGHRPPLEAVISIRSAGMPSCLMRERRLHLSIPAGQSGPST